MSANPASILTEDMKRVVREQRLGFVATVCPDGTPNLSPKGTTRVWDDNALVFADLRSPQTVENLRSNPAIEINVVDPVLRKGYRFKGTAEVISEGSRLLEFIDFFAREGLEEAGLRVRNCVLIHVERALPLISPAYDRGLDEEQIMAVWQRHYRSLWRKQQRRVRRRP